MEEVFCYFELNLNKIIHHGNDKLDLGKVLVIKKQIQTEHEFKVKLYSLVQLLIFLINKVDDLNSMSIKSKVKLKNVLSYHLIILSSNSNKTISFSGTYQFNYDLIKFQTLKATIKTF